MPARKALTTGLEYLVARHPQHGLILYDASRHDDPALAAHLVYCFPINAEIPVPRGAVWEECSDDIARVDLLNIVHCYNNFRVLRVGPAQTHRVALKEELRQRRVLVVDDVAMARSVLGGMLSRMSLRVTEASSGAEAVAVVRAAAEAGDPFGLVFLDWQMPGMDGLEASRRIGALRLASPPHCILVTAYPRGDLLRQAAEAGIERVLAKPASPSTLFDSTVETLSGWRPR